MTPDASTLEALAGHYRLRPGGTPAVAGTRPVLAAGTLATLLHGKDPALAGQLVSQVFALCAGAHRLAAELAVGAAACGAPQEPSPHASALLLLDTLRDHLRTLALEWPQRLRPAAPAPGALAWLQGCPLPLAGSSGAPDPMARVHAFGRWFESSVLRQPAAAWLQEHAQDEALARWCRQAGGRVLPAALLADVHPLLSRFAPPARCFELPRLSIEARGGALRELASALWANDGFAQSPTWRGQPRENGPWCRPAPPAATGESAGSAWTRLAARLREVARVATIPGGATAGAPPLLAAGAVATGPGEAIAWCEMARGLLCHAVRLDGGRIAGYRVLAPTEWNFHPQGTLGQLVGQLDPADRQSARMLAAAFDPCVPCTVVDAA